MEQKTKITFNTKTSDGQKFNIYLNVYKKRVVVQNKSNLLLKIILHNT